MAAIDDGVGGLFAEEIDMASGLGEEGAEVRMLENGGDGACGIGLRESGSGFIDPADLFEERVDLGAEAHAGG